MSNVLEICIADRSGDGMINVTSIEAVANKGIINDRYFKDKNEVDTQITLIESENIDNYNAESGSNISYISFRRNIITQGIKLNELEDKKLLIGKVRIKVHRLCNPCRYLHEKLKQKNLVKKIINRSGLRCEILTSGKILIDDKIKIIN